MPAKGPFRCYLREEDARREVPFGSGQPDGYRFDAKGARVVIAPLLLGTASWVHPKGHEFDHGSAVFVRVEAPNLDGRKVRFIVERKDGEAWRPYETLEAVVQDGAAQAPIEINHPVFSRHNPHPSADEVKAAEPAKLRFHAELV